MRRHRRPLLPRHDRSPQGGKQSLRTAALCALIVTAVLAGGGAAADDSVLPLPAADAKELTAHLGPGVVGAALPSKPIEDVTQYFPLRERAPSYLVTAGKNAGATHTLNVAKGKRPNGLPAWRLELAESLAAFLRQTDDGDLIMPAVADSGEGLLIVTTPPNPFLLKGMQPGETRTLSQSVAVNYLDNPTQQDYSGTLTARYTYVGTYQVTVPAGTYAAVLLRLDYEGKIGPAHTEDTAYYLFAPGVGLVAMVSQEDVEAFWIVHIDTTNGKVLASN
jgi:hypothetical protein